MRRRFSLGLFLFAISLAAGIRGAWKYNGVVIFDRWGSCYLYSGVYLMNVSEAVKDSLRQFQNKAILLDAKQVYQPRNPGDGLITQLQVLGPAVERATMDGLSLLVRSEFSNEDTDRLVIQLENKGQASLPIDLTQLAPTLFAKKSRPLFWQPADGPSYAAITRQSVANLLMNPNERAPWFTVESHSLLPRQMHLAPGEHFDVRLGMRLEAGEYEFLAGYGGGVHSTRTLASNQISFDIDARGKAR